MSHRASDLPFWEPVYRDAFPTMEAMVDHRGDGEHQRAGIDRSIILANSKQILIDEKVRFKDYGDILLEYWSNAERKVPGWVCKPLRADFIAYAIAPAGKCYLLPVLQLQRAWEIHGDEWKRKYKPRKALNENGNGNGRYTTICLAISVGTLFSAIGNCLRIYFEPLVPNETKSMCPPALKQAEIFPYDKPPF